MIQFNLLPDIKLQYIKAKKQEHMVIAISVVAIIASFAILAVLIAFVDVIQKSEINGNRNYISQQTKQIQNTPNLSQILTVQNQLKILPSLHESKPEASRLFNFLTQLTPTAASISKFSIDFTQNTFEIDGSANNLATVNQFTDTLKFTGYTVQGQTGSQPAFSNVVLASFSEATSSGATYSITASFDPTIFQNTSNVILTVPGVINTRSDVSQPGVLFTQNGS